MKRGLRTAALAVWAALVAFAAPGLAHAQGVTTSAITGTVSNAQGQPLPGIQITATNTQSGTSYRVVTRSDGRFLLQGLQPGGPYRITATGLGFATATRTGVDLVLSQTSRFDFTLSSEAVALEGLTVEAERGSQVISKGRTGSATVVSDSAIARLPTITRDFTDFTRLTPQISTAGDGSNAGGRSSRYNSIQIDGASNNDLFGLNASGTPGGSADARPISIEAIQEFQVVISPFDVRQGGFTGAGINAITKSGTNDFTGSLAYFNRNESLVGNFKFPDSGRQSEDFGDFSQHEGAFSLGGPILRDRLHFFVAGEINRRSAPINNVAGTPTSELSLDTVNIVADILRDQYGYNPGEVGALDLDTDNNNLFGRLDWAINDNHRLTLRHNYLDGFRGDLDRSNSTYRLGGSLFTRDNTTNSTVLQLNSILPRQIFNEFRVGYQTVDDIRNPQDRTPSVRIFLGNSRSVFAGSEQFSGQNELDQKALEITNDLTFALGRHNLTLGTRNEFFRFSNLFVRNAYGFYEFDNITDLRAGDPSRYEYSYLLPGGNPRAEFDTRQFAVYLQDQIDLASNLTVTAGLRYDYVSFPDEPGRNTAFEAAFPSLNRRTDVAPSSGLFNPRVGFNWDVTGDRTTQVRGGVGLFSGRTPGVWISNVYGNTGLDYVRFTCSGKSRAPAFVSDPAGQPTTCEGSTSLVPNEINLADPDFKLPQVLRTSLGIDRELPFGFVGTLEGIYTKSRHDVLYRELNLGAQVGTVEGRPRFGGPLTSSFANVTDITNSDQGDNYSLTAQVQRPFRNGWDVNAAYTFSRTRDVNSVTSSQAFSNFRFNPINGDPNDPELARSNFDVPHRVLLAATRQINLLRRAPTDLSFIYVGESGRPYSFTYNGDVNNDGSNANDLLYVPANASEIRFEAFRAPTATNPGQPITPEQSYENLNAFIESVECLRENRGQVLDRNECRQPWVNRLDVKVAQSLPSFGGQNLQLTMNVFNFLNLLNEEWGVNQFVSNQNNALLRTSSTTPNADGRVVFRAFDANSREFNTSNLNSRYQIQLGVRYSF